MTGGVDLHSHTTASDGTLTPRELVAAAARRGVRVLAITDHDSTEGLREAFDEAARRPPLTIVPGLEINCDVPGAEVHILGYYVDHEAAWFQDFLREQRVERAARVHRIAARLAELGMPIDPAAIFAIVREGSPGRPHVAQVMVNLGYVKSVREAFDKYLHANGPANVPRKRLTPADAVRIIRRARGVPVFAHPGLADRDTLVPELVDAGLMGIEAWYAEHSAAQTAHYRELCRQHGLVATGGSDYHGERSGRTNPLGHPPVPMRVWEELKDAARRAREQEPGNVQERTQPPQS
ncbi:MAG TPA: PHP domain-containing protein [Methylomirabilota bacterium]|nr:PHP domain-containing protein [Methylomirabilota bacterium]